MTPMSAEEPAMTTMSAEEPAMTPMSAEEPAMTTMSAEEPAMTPMSAEEPAMAASSEEPAMAAAADPKLPGANLSTDTRAAAAGDVAEGFGYIGAWAVDAAACGLVDQAGAANFAVITRSTFRDSDQTYFGSFGPLVDGKLSLTARAAQGTRMIALEQAAADKLTVDGKALIRCVQ
jgi:hypothetical protein